MWTVKKQNKYRNVRQSYNGYVYMSKRESSFAQELDIRLMAKDFKSWHKQVPISFDVTRSQELIARSTHPLLPKVDDQNFTHLCKYYVDFLIQHHDGTIELIEIKSPITMTGEWKLKRKLLEATWLTTHGDFIKYTVLT